MRYKLNPESPFFSHMQNTTVEKNLTEEQLHKRYHLAVNAIVFSGFEGQFINDDQKNYLIYAFINDVDSDTIFNTLMNTPSQTSKKAKLAQSVLYFLRLSNRSC